MITSLKNVMSYSKRKFLSYLVCVASFKSVNNSPLSRKRYGGGNFTLTSRLLLQGQNTSVGVGLIERTELSNTLNTSRFLNIARIILHVFLMFIFV